MEVSNEKIINTLASNMASYIGSLEVQLAKSEAVIEALQKQNAELQGKLATYERGETNGTKRIKSDNEQESGQSSERDTTTKWIRPSSESKPADAWWLALWLNR